MKQSRIQLRPSVLDPGGLATNLSSGQLLRIRMPHLHRIVMTGRPELYERMGSYSIRWENTKGLAVMRLVALHPNVASKDLEKLVTRTNEYVLGDIAGNLKISEGTLRRLAAHGGFLIEWGLAHNPNTPPSILSRVAQSVDEYQEPASQ